MQLTTGNVIVDQMAQVNLDAVGVTVVPHTWYRNITNPRTDKPYMTAITILADTVYWYRPTAERDEYTGQIIAYRKKFKGDLVQHNYSYFDEMFGFSEKQCREAIQRLEELNLLHRVLRDVKTEHGETLRNVMYLSIDPEEIEAITYRTQENKDSEGVVPIWEPRVDHMGTTSLPYRNHVLPKRGPRVDHMETTNTYITTKNTTENSSSVADRSLIDDAGPLINDEALICLNSFDEEDINLFRVAMGKLFQLKSSSTYHIFGPALKEQLSRMNQSRREAMYRRIAQSYLEACRKNRIDKKIPYMMTCIVNEACDMLAISDRSRGISQKPDYNAMAMKDLMEKLNGLEEEKTNE